MKKIIKIIIGLIILIAIVITCIAIFGKKEKEPIIEGTTKYSYKGFDFEVPNDIKFALYDTHSFMITNGEWRANIELFHDTGHKLTQNADKYYEIMKSANFQITKPQTIEVMNKKLISYNRDGSQKSTILLGNYIGNFSFQIDYFSPDNDYDISKISEVLKVLDTGVYRLNDHTVFYYHDVDRLLNYAEGNTTSEE